MNLEFSLVISSVKTQMNGRRATDKQFPKQADATERDSA